MGLGPAPVVRLERALAHRETPSTTGENHAGGAHSTAAERAYGRDVDRSNRDPGRRGAPEGGRSSRHAEV
jgi:hypothetical protein